MADVNQMSDGNQLLTWFDVLKLTIPVISAVAVVWLRAWYAQYLERKNKQKALFRILKDEIESLS